MVSVRILIGCLAVSLLSLTTRAQFALTAITGLTAGQAALAGIAGLGGAVALGGALGGGLSALSNRGRGRSNSRGRSRSRGRGRGRRYGRRSVQQPELELQDHLQIIMQFLASMDVNDCGKRYLCEVASYRSEDRTKEENLTIDLFQGKGVEDSIEVGALRAAAHFGTVAKSIRPCITKYTACDVGKTPMRELIKAEGIDTQLNLV